jgi:hypothetical protein
MNSTKPNLKKYNGPSAYPFEDAEIITKDMIPKSIDSARSPKNSKKTLVDSEKSENDDWCIVDEEFDYFLDEKLDFRL